MCRDFSWFVGIDWATEAHAVCQLDAQGAVRGEREFNHSGEGLAALCDWLTAVSGCEAERIAVAIEVPHGAVVDTLMERSFAVHAVNPKQLDRFRDRFTVAGAKDDRRDALVLASALRTDRHCFRRLDPTRPEVIELREWSRIAADLQQERTRLGNRIREQLRRYFPQALQVTDDVAAGWFLDLWTKIPTPDKAARVREETISALLKRNRIRRIDAGKALEILRQPRLHVAAGTTQAAVGHIETLVERLRVVNRELKKATKRVDQLLPQIGAEEQLPGQSTEQRDVTILRSMPGIGRIVCATLLAEAYNLLQTRDYHALRALCGVAPVTKRSGKRHQVVMRQACHLRLRTAVYHWSRVAVQHDATSRSRYQALRGRGHSHARALRSVADRLLGVACAMLRTGTLFDPDRTAEARLPGAA